MTPSAEIRSGLKYVKGKLFRGRGGDDYVETQKLVTARVRIANARVHCTTHARPIDPLRVARACRATTSAGAPLRADRVEKARVHRDWGRRRARHAVAGPSDGHAYRALSQRARDHSVQSRSLLREP